MTVQCPWCYFFYLTFIVRNDFILIVFFLVCIIFCSFICSLRGFYNMEQLSEGLFLTFFDFLFKDWFKNIQYCIGLSTVYFLLLLTSFAISLDFLKMFSVDSFSGLWSYNNLLVLCVLIWGLSYIVLLRFCFVKVRNFQKKKTMLEIFCWYFPTFWMCEVYEIF